MHNKYQDIQNTKANFDDSGTDWRTKEFSHPERIIRVGTSFSGIGAIEHALHRLGLNIQIQFAGDIDPECKRAYFANYDIDESRWHTDIHDFSAKPFLDQVDLFVGGAPCQAFSMRGKRGGFEDTRGTLFSEFARVVIECKPKVFIFENVKGMLNHDKGNTWKVIKQTFEEDCDYDVYYQVLNGRNYGIPQSRDRIYCIGFRRETDFKYPAPIPLQKSMYDYLEQVVDPKYLLKERGVHFITEAVNHEKSYTQINGEVMLCQKRNQQFNWHGDFVFHPALIEDKTNPDTDDYLYRIADYETDYYATENLSKYAVRFDDKNRLHLLNDSAVKIATDRGRYRKLTPRECHRLMGFDDTFRIVVPDTAAYKQAGNSIIVDVLIALLRQMDITQYGV
jgi:DNA (cytosine-5)-methyltransferase 1